MRRRPRRATLGPLPGISEQWPQTVAWQVRQIGELPRKDAPPALVTPWTIPQTARKGRLNFLYLITALDALNGSLVTHMQIDDQPVWRFKHPTIGDAYAATLAFSPDLLGIFLSGSSTENLTSQITCGNVGVEKAVVVPKSLFPMMVARLREFSASDKYKVQWLSSWGARYTFEWANQLSALAEQQQRL